MSIVDSIDSKSIISSISIYHEVRTTQIFDACAMGCIWKKVNTIDPGQKSLLESLYRKRKYGNQVPVIYRLSSSKPGQLGYGRLFGSKGSLEQIEKNIRGSLCMKYYWDVDIVNCHPVLLIQYAKQQYDVSLPYLESYVANRDDKLESLLKQGIEKDDGKMMVPRCLYGGKPTKECPKWIRGIYDEVLSFSKKLIPNHEELYEYCVKQDANVLGSFMSYIIQTEERKCMMAMYSAFKRTHSVDVLCYDGIMIRKLIDETVLNPDLIADCEQKVLDITGYAIKLKVKPFEPMDLEDLMTKTTADGISEKDYLDVKLEWEKMHFYFMELGCIVEINKDNTLTYMGLEMAKNNYGNKYKFIIPRPIGEQRVDFITLWMKDAERKTYKKISLSPPDEEGDTYSLFNGFKFQTYEKACPNKEEIVEIFSTVMEHITNRNEAMKTYLMKWFAYMIQKPFENPFTCIIVTGLQGCGKDMIGRLLGRYIIGEYLYNNYENPGDFWEKHDLGRQGKLFIHCEETEGYMNRKYAATFKGRITSPMMTLNPKGLNSFKAENRCHYYMTTNDEVPVKCEKTDRRYVVIPSGNWLVGKNEFWKRCASLLESDEAGKVIGDLLMGLDISGFNPTEIVESDYKKHLMESSKSVEERFVDLWDGVEITSKELYGKYKVFCEEQEAEAKTPVGFGMKLLPFVRDCVIRRKESNSITYYTKTSTPL
jgi:hypothetical protein